MVRHPATHLADSRHDDTWRLYCWDVYARCFTCPSGVVAWAWRGHEYCNDCAQQIRDVSSRLLESGEARG